MNLKDWLTVSGMWLAGFVLISIFLAFTGVVAKYATYFFCVGYGC